MKTPRLMTDVTVEFDLPPTRAITSVRVMGFVYEPEQLFYTLEFTGGPEGVDGHYDSVEGDSVPMAAYKAGQMLSLSLSNLVDEMRRRGYTVKGHKFANTPFQVPVKNL